MDSEGNKPTETQSPPVTSQPAADGDKDGFDKLLSTVGFGRWQFSSVILVIFVALILPVHLIGVSLLCAPMHFRCFMNPNEPTSDTSFHETSTNATTTTSQYYNDVCLPVEGRVAILEDIANATMPPGRYATGMATCPYIEYDTTVFSSTIFSQFHLTCERASWQSFYQVVYSIGSMLGSTISGQIGDKCGRIATVKFGAMLNCVGVLIQLLSSSYPLVLLARLLLGCSSMGTLIPAWNLVLEITPVRHRSVVGMLMGTPYSFFIVVFAVLGYYIRDWGFLFLINSLPIIVLLPLSLMIDESPRWLLQQGRRKEALKIMEKVVRKNKVKLNTPLSSCIDSILRTNGSRIEGVSEQGTTVSFVERLREGRHKVWQYFKSPGMRVIFFVTPFLWFLHSFLYLGVAINATNFTDTNPFLYVGLTGVMDGSSILLITPLAIFLGRRVLIGWGLFIGGVLLVTDILVPVDYSWVKWVLVMTGFFLCAGAFQVNFIYAPELFPTEFRARGYAFVNMMGSIGFMCAPFITTSLARYTWWAGSVVFGCSGIVASLLIPLLPETNKRPLPETLQDVDRRWRNRRWKGNKDGIENKSYELGGDTVL